MKAKRHDFEEVERSLLCRYFYLSSATLQHAMKSKCIVLQSLLFSSMTIAKALLRRLDNKHL